MKIKSEQKEPVGQLKKEKKEKRKITT